MQTTLKDHGNCSIELRRRAEERLGNLAGTMHHQGAEEEPQRLLHELQLHRIELEMQNSELHRAIDEREKTELLLGKYSDLYECAPVGYFTLDRQGTIRAANLTGSAIMGVERSRLVGLRFGQFVPVDSRPGFSAYIDKIFTSRTKQKCETALLKEGNSSLFVQIEAVAAESGQDCYIALIDITERKLAEAEINKLNADLAARTAELESSNQELEAFNYMASHDLVKPLNNIFSASQALELLCGDNLDEECTEVLRIIKNGAMNMSRQIGMFLRFSRSVHAELRREMVGLSDMAKAVADEQRLSEPGRRVSFKIEKGLMASGDPDLLRVVLENLFSNAWKHTAGLKQATIEFGKVATDNRATCFIRDNGAGFEMQEAESLFQPFRCQPGSDNRERGIGLATVERIIRRHGGKVWGVGEPGKGATFFFTLGD